MPLPHLLLALLVVLIWGTNFVVIKWGLSADMPPLLFAALRFVFSALPWVFLFRRPAVPWSALAATGMFVGLGQFGMLYWAMRADISPGMAALVVQSQVFFTIVMSVILRGERFRVLQLAALALAIAGYVVVGWRTASGPAASVTPLGLGMVLTAAFCWACANIVVGRVGRLSHVDMLGFVAWSSLFPIVPLLLLSLSVEGRQAVMHALSHADMLIWASVFWQSVVNTLLCFAAWNWLLARHATMSVVPMALLIPVIGILSSAVLTGEALPAWKIVAAGLVLAGLALNVYEGRRTAVRRVAPAGDGAV